MVNKEVQNHSKLNYSDLYDANVLFDLLRESKPGETVTAISSTIAPAGKPTAAPPPGPECSKPSAPPMPATETNPGSGITPTQTQETVPTTPRAPGRRKVAKIPKRPKEKWFTMPEQKMLTHADTEKIHSATGCKADLRTSSDSLATSALGDVKAGLTETKDVNCNAKVKSKKKALNTFKVFESLGNGNFSSRNKPSKEAVKGHAGQDDKSPYMGWVSDLTNQSPSQVIAATFKDLQIQEDSTKPNKLKKKITLSDYRKTTLNQKCSLY